MDAWANVSHYLDYKSERDVPSELRRDFFALSGLFYVADKHFEMFYGTRRQSKEEMSEFFEEAAPDLVNREEVNLDSMGAYIHNKFPDREQCDPKGISELIDILLESGYKSIGDVDRLLEKTNKAFQRYEELDPPVSGRYNGVGVIRISAKLLDEKFLRLDAKAIGKQLGWSAERIEENIQDSIIESARYRRFVEHADG